VGWIVGLTLAGWAAATIAVGAAIPRARAEVSVVYLPVAVALIGAGRTVQNRRLGRPERDRGARYYRGAIALAGLVACICSPAAFYAFNSEPFVPSAKELLPVRAGLTAVVEESDGGSCGSGVCALFITVTGGPGQPANDVLEQVRQHLTNRGWRLDLAGEDCRPVGWLLDRRTMCVSVAVRDDAVHVSFDGVRAWP
jgi:hypothetical protein